MNGAQSLASISAIWWCGWWSSCCEDGRSVIEDCHGERGAGCAGTRGPLPFYELILCCQLGWLHIVFIEHNIALCWRPYHEGLAPFSHKAGSLNHWLEKRLGDRSNGWIGPDMPLGSEDMLACPLITSVAKQILWIISSRKLAWKTTLCHNYYILETIS